MKRFLWIALLIVLIIGSLLWWLVDGHKHGHPGMNSFITSIFSQEKHGAPDVTDYHTAYDVLRRQTIIKLTNDIRSTNSIAPLREDYRLDTVADLRVDNIFATQATKAGPPTDGDLAHHSRIAGYKETIVAENIAEGMFSTNKDIIGALMADRASKMNILRSDSTDIGVALRRGLVNGRNVYVVVQVFGVRSSMAPGPLCSAPPSSLLRDVEKKKRELESLGKERFELSNKLVAEKQAIERLRSSPESLWRDQTLKEKVTAYNKKVEVSNGMMDKLRKIEAERRAMSDEYTRLQTSYNLCLGKK